MSIFIIIATLLFNLIFYFNLKKVSEKINIFDYPDNLRKDHKVVVPPIGGVDLFLSIILFSSLNVIIEKKIFFENFFFIEHNIDIKSLSAFYFGLLFLFILGLLDDKNGVSANIRLLFFSVIYYFALLLDNQLILNTIEIDTLQIEINLENLKIFFTICCFLVLINSLNMFDGINIQFGLYLLILFLIFAFKEVFFNFSILIVICLVFFLYFNFKNKIFFGNQGVYLISFVITFFIIKDYNTTDRITAEEVYLLLYLPILDLLRLFVIRIYNNKNPFDGDKNHIHHYINNKTKNDLKTSLITNFIAFFPFFIYSYYESFYILIFTTTFYFLLIPLIKKQK